MPSVSGLLSRPLRRIVSSFARLEDHLSAFIRRTPTHRRFARISAILLSGCTSIVLMGGNGCLGCVDQDHASLLPSNTVAATLNGLFNGLAQVPYGNARNLSPHPRVTGTDGSTTGLASFLGNFTAIAQSPNFFALVRQPDCSLGLLTGTATLTGSVSITGGTSNYEQTLHQLASLKTTPDKFPNGCSDPHTGISSRVAVFAGLTTGGIATFATAESNGNTNAVFVLTANSALTSVNFTPIATLPSATALATADLNGDGNGDLVVVNQAAQSAFVSVTLGSASGTFGTPVNYPIAGTTSAAAVIDDVNNDGKLDIVAVSTDQQISVLLGKGDGTFQAAQSFAAPTLPGYTSTSNTPILGLITADVNGDGNKDIIASNGLILLGNGKGTFTAASAPAFPFSASSPGGFGPGLAAGDLNNDGHADLVVDTGTNISIYLGSGSGTFTLANSYASISNSGYVTLTDLDGDGNLDIYSGLADGSLYSGDDTNNSAAYVLMGNGDGSFVGAPTAPNGTYTGTNLGDVNGDGVPDLITTANSTANTPTLPFTVQLSNGKGGFTTASSIAPPSTYVVNGVTIVSSYVASGISYSDPGNPATYAVVDVNGDGKADLVFLLSGLTALNANNNNAPYAYPYPVLFVALSNGNGTFATPVPYAIPQIAPPAGYDNSVAVSNLQIADINKDGHNDLIMTVNQTGSNGVSGEVVQGLLVLLGNGNGTFSSTPIITTTYTGSTAPTSNYLPQVLSTADLNGDGIPDLVVNNTTYTVANGTVSQLETFLGKGDGTFKAPVSLSVAANEYGIPTLADFNKDGKLDIAFIAETTAGQGEIVVSLGKGDGTFASPTISNIEGGDAVRSATLTAADFNADGNPDLALIDAFDYSGVFYGTGSGTFSSVPQTGYIIPKDLLNLAPSIQQATVAIDLNKDGKPDLLAGNTVLLNLYGAASTTLASTSTALTASATAITTGNSVTLTATITPPTGSTVTPTGTVTFYVGTTSIGTGTLNVSGVATLTTTSLTTGTNSITATYSGDTNYSGSTSSAITVTVNAPVAVSTTTTLAATSTSAVSGTSITFTASVQPASGTAIPSGMVTFTDGSTTLGTGTLNASGVTTYSTASLAIGSHSIVATYAGLSGSFAGSASSAVGVTITAAPAPTFTIALAPASSTVNPGSSTSTTLTLTPQNGFNQATTLVCDGAPTGSTCSISPNSLTPTAATPANATVTLQTTASVADLHGQMQTSVVAAALPSGLLVALLGFLRPQNRRRRLPIKLCAVMLLSVVLGLTSCSKQQATAMQTPSTAILTVTATSGTLVQTATWTVTIE